MAKNIIALKKEAMDAGMSKAQAAKASRSELEDFISSKSKPRKRTVARKKTTATRTRTTARKTTTRKPATRKATTTTRTRATTKKSAQRSAPAQSRNSSGKAKRRTSNNDSGANYVGTLNWTKTDG